MGSAARQFPHALAQRGCQSLCDIAPTGHFPVLFVHGYAGNESVWKPLRDELTRAGFGHFVSLRYNSFACDPTTLASEVAHQVLRASRESGAPQVHLVGHSLGGLIVREAVTQPAMEGLVATAVTIASPHHGAALARIALGPCGPIMQRGTPNAPGPHDVGPQARWLAYYSDGDRIVPPASARLDDAGYAATNVLIPGCGHLTICRDQRLIGSLVRALIRSESLGAEAMRAPAGIREVAV